MCICKTAATVVLDTFFMRQVGASESGYNRREALPGISLVAMKKVRPELVQVRV